MQYSRRLATVEDLSAIVSIYNSTVASRQVTADTEPVSVESRRGWFSQHLPDRRPLWVAQSGAPVQQQSDIVGWLSFSDFYGRPAYSGTAELSIYVRADMRRQGVGRYLLQEAIAHAPAIGVHTLLGFIFGHNHASLALFEAFGFTRWGHLPEVAVLDGVARDLIIVGYRVA